MSEADNKGVETFADKDVVEVSKDFFFDGMLLSVNVYIKLKDKNYLIIGNKGSVANFSSLHSFHNPNSKLYVHASEYPLIVNYINQMVSKIASQKNVPDQIKIKFVSGLAEDALATLERGGFTSVAKIQAVSQTVVKMVEHLPTFSEVAKILETLHSDEAKHAMTTCFVSLMLCEEMDVTLPAAQEKVAMASLLHDVGMKFVAKSILQKPRHLWTAEEQAIYEQHPLKGVETLRDIKDISNDVLLIISEHHENSLGTGFPKKIRDIKISPLGKIVGLGNYFASLIFNTHPEGRTYTADEAISYIEDILGQPFNKKVFLALKNIVNKKYLKDKTG